MIHDGIFKIGDFGFAKIAEPNSETKTILGTPLYMVLSI